MFHWFFERKRKGADVLTDENSMSDIPPLASRQFFNNVSSVASDSPSVSGQSHQEYISVAEPDNSQTSYIQQISASQNEIDLIRGQQHRHHETQQVIAHRAEPSRPMRHGIGPPLPPRNEETPSSPRLPDTGASPIISRVPEDQEDRSTSLEHVSARQPRSWQIWRRIRPRERYSHIHPNDRPYFKKFVKNAQWLDGRRICCGCCRIGADAILGLIPVVGDFAGAAFSLALVRKAQQRWDLPLSLVSRMYANIFLDTVLGLIPIIGFFLDIAHKSNMKNARLLEEYLSQLYQQDKCGITDEAQTRQLPTLSDSPDKSDSECNENEDNGNNNV